MFNLEEQISAWRQHMLAAGINSPAPLEELESHLREEIDQQARSGASEPEAFILAQAQIGQAQVLRTEFASVREPAFERLKRLFYAVAGIPNYQLATNMNMNTTERNLEPRWATYLKTAAFFVPALFVLMGMCVFILPKLKEILAAANMVLWGPIVLALDLLDFVRVHSIILSLATIAALILVEWRSDRWPRYRRLVFGFLAFSLNIVVLVLITALAVLAVAAGAHLLPGK
jgi:hypothetical protein